jgi:hypothetical protein
MKKLNIRASFLSVAMSAVPGLSNAGYLYVNSSAQTYGLATENAVESDSNPVITSSSSNNGGSANSMAYAGFGVLKVAGQASAIASTESPARGNSHSQAYFADDVNILADGMAGNAFVTANLLVSGNLVAGNNDNGGGFSASQFFLSTTGGVQIDGHSSVGVGRDLVVRDYGWTLTTSEGTINGFDDMFRLYTFDIPILLGTDFSLSVRLDGYASVSAILDQSNPGFAFASYDLGHSLYWAGISALRDANGNLITDYSLTSGSGVDYRNSLVPVSSVPELPAFWLLLSGLVGLSLLKRKSQRSFFLPPLVIQVRSA